MIDRDKQMQLYHEEQNMVFEQFLHDHFFQYWGEKFDHRRRDIPSIELILFPKCNYRCTYCYITNHGDELYPDIENEDPNLIIDNLKKVLKWVIKNNFHLDHFDLFSAEFFAQKQWSEVLECIYFAMKTNYVFTNIITIPTNMSFVMNAETVARVKEYRKRFLELGVFVHLSGSVEGLHCDNLTRPGATKYTEEFYRRLFEFAREEDSGFHPMVSTGNIEAWKDNYKWWIEMHKKYDIHRVYKYRKKPKDRSSNPSHVGTPFLLEVRNDDWTPEKINTYTDFLRFEFEYLLHEVFNDDIGWFAASLLKLNLPDIDTSLQNTMLSIIPEGRITCSIQRQLFIRVRYLDIVPCHRTCYDKFQYGSFITDESGEISGYKANNLPMMMKVLEMNPIYSMPKCCSCQYSMLCMGQCLGAMFESCGDPFVPADSVCAMFHAKYKTLASLYKEYDIFNAAKKFVADEGIKIPMEELKMREELLCRMTQK